MKTCTRFLAVALLTAFAAAAQAGFVSSHTNYTKTVLTSPLGAGLPIYELKLGSGSGIVNTTHSFTIYLDQGQSVSGHGAYDPHGLSSMLLASGLCFSYVTVSYDGITKNLGTFTSREWKEWSYTATELGLTAYKFTYGVQGYALKPAYGIFTAVPEPSTWIGGVLASLLIVPSLFRSSRIRISKG